MKYFVLFALSLSLTPASFAARGPLEKRVQKIQFSCPTINCPEVDAHLADMSRTEIKNMTPDLKSKIKEAIVDLAQDLWPDTILEGSYENLGRFRIEQIQKLYFRDELSAYRVTYSDKAWDLDTCQYDQNNPETLKACATGRIFESAFIALDFSEVFRDETDMAEYVPDTAAVQNPQDSGLDPEF